MGEVDKNVFEGDLTRFNEGVLNALCGQGSDNLRFIDSSAPGEEVHAVTQQAHLDALGEFFKHGENSGG